MSFPTSALLNSDFSTPSSSGTGRMGRASISPHVDTAGSCCCCLLLLTVTPLHHRPAAGCIVNTCSDFCCATSSSSSFFSDLAAVFYFFCSLFLSLKGFGWEVFLPFLKYAFPEVPAPWLQGSAVPCDGLVIARPAKASPHREENFYIH